MKLRRVFLGAAVVALMAACGGKTETTTETATPAEETQVEEVATAPVEEAEAPVAKNDAKPAAKANAKSDKAAPAAKVAKEDPCKAKVEKFIQFADELEAAQKNRTSGQDAFKKYTELSKRLASEEAAVSECMNEPAYKASIQKAMRKAKSFAKK